MWIEIARLVMGLLIAVFHCEIAAWITNRDRALAEAFAARGLRIPGALPLATATSFCFVTGIGIALLQIAKIWLSISAS